MFQDLEQLRVLDLSFNMLTRLHPLMYPSLRNLGVDVRLSGNSWQCDCNMHSLQSWMAYDSRKGLQTWSVVCASPSSHSGRDLLQVPEEDLNCYDAENRPKLHQDITVNKGSEMLLTCFTPDPVWWTPNGQASVVQPEGGLLISDITEAYTGLYVCVSESEQKIMAVYSLQISETRETKRKARSLPQYGQEIIPLDTLNRKSQNRAVSQSNLALAVCLSVFITFLIAFILGVLARPFICTLWGRVTKKKSSSAPNSVQSEEQQQYDNEAFASGEDPEDLQPHRERRVTFSEITENITVQYYDTVVREDQESVNNDVFENEPCEAEKHKHTDGDSDDFEKDQLSVSSVSGADHTGTVEYEHIPDQERTSLSSHSSHSSLSGKEDKRDQGHHSTANSLQVSEDTIQQRADLSTLKTVEVPQITTEDRDDIPGFSSEPFTDWPPHDKWQNGDEPFDFSDSVRSTSARSSIVNSSFNDPKLIVLPSLDKQRVDSTSSSSSSVSDDEPTHYTVNPDSEDEQDTERYRNHRLIHNVDPGLTNTPLRQDEKPVMRAEHSFSSHSSESDEAQMHYKVQQDTKEEEGMGKGLGLDGSSSRNPLENKAPSEVSSSSSSESEAEIKDLKVGKENKMNKPKPLLTDHHLPKNISAKLSVSGSSTSDDNEDETIKPAKTQEVGDEQMGTLDAMKHQWPALDLEHTPSIKRRLDFKVTPSSSSSETLKDNAAQINKHEKGGAEVLSPTVDLVQIKKPLEKAPSPPRKSSSSSDSEDETANQGVKQNQEMKFPNQESKTVTQDPELQWSAHNVEHVTPNRKPSSIVSDSSSSSDSEDETKFQKKNTEVETHWPVTDLEGRTVVKTFPHIKTPSPPPESSSSSDSEEEDVKLEQQKSHLGKFPNQPSTSVNCDPESKWPSLDLEHIPPIKRRLDIKSSTQDSDSSSSSDSDGERVNQEVRQQQEKPIFTKFPNQSAKTVSYESETKWPTLDLEHIPSIKSRLDIKAPTAKFESSSSSDSEDDTTNHKDKPRPKQRDISKPLFQESQKITEDENTWPALDLGQVTPIKRRLDIKAPSAPPESSQSESDDDKKQQMPQEQGKTEMERFPNKESKRPLDIKSSSQEPDSSSSSDSDDERVNHEVKQKQEKQLSAKLPNQASKTVSHEPDSKWPTLNLEHIPSIKRRLDIKAPSAECDSPSNSEDEATQHTNKSRPMEADIVKHQLHQLQSSSSSDSEDEGAKQKVKQKQENVYLAKVKNQESITVSHDPETQWPALHLEQVTKIKRRLDIKAPSPESDSSSSGDGKDKTTHHTEKHDLETHWPSIDLEHGTHLKRRLDIKAPTPDSSSSSDSEVETKNYYEKTEQIQKHKTELPLKVSQTVSNNPDTQWPVVNLEHNIHVKRRLDVKLASSSSSSTSPEDMDTTRPLEIKPTSQPNDSSSSSDSEDEITHQIVVQKPGKAEITGPAFQRSPTGHVPQAQWGAVDLSSITRINRRLDIKAPSPPPDSLSSGGSSHTVKMEEIKKMSSSSSSDEEEAVLDQPLTVKKRKTYMGNVNDPYIKRRLNIRAPPQPGDSSNSDTDSKHSSPTVKYESNTGDGGNTKTEQQNKLHNSGIPQISRRLDIKAPSQQPDAVLSSVSSGSSSSDSEDENMNHKAKLGTQASAISKGTQKDFIRTPKTPMMNISPSPKTSSVKLEKYIAIRDDFGSLTTIDSRDTAPESNQELQSRWATMNLGISRFRKRLDIMSRTNEPPKLPSSPTLDSPSTSSSSSESEPEKKSGSNTKSSLKDQVDNSVKVKEPLRTDFSLPTNWEKSNQNTVLTGVGIQHVDHNLDIKVRQKTAATPALQQQLDHSSSSNNKRDVNIKASSLKEPSSSSSEDETSSHWVPDLTSGIPRVKRSLYIKAPSPPASDSSSSFSESESSHASKLTSLTEEPIIQYKRTIIKSSLSATSTSSGTDGQWHRNKEAGKLSLAEDNSSSRLSFDDIVKRKTQQSKHRADADLPPSIRWTGISSSLSDHSTPSLRTQQIPPTVPGHPLDSSSSSSSESEDKVKQDKVTTDRTLMHKYLSFSSSSASLASSKALDQSDNSFWSANDISGALPEDRKERKGLSALKVMSSERREWDIQYDIDESPLFANQSSQSDTSLIYQTPETLLSPSSERSPADMLYNISRYRRHLNENTGPPQEAPPPVPATPPPDDAVELTWSSSQRSKEQGRSLYLQQRKSMTSHEPQDQHSPNISEV